MLGRLSVLKVVRLKLSKFFRSFILSLKRIPHLHNKSEYKKILRSRTALIGILGLIIGISLVSVFLLKGRGASANWYNDNWKYRKSVALPNHTAEESNVFVTIPIDTATLIGAGKLQSDCGDFRFTDNTGKLLEYYISSGCNTSDTKIDVNMSTYAAGSLVLYAYYGNPLVENGFSLTGFSASASNNATTINLQVNASGDDGDTQIAGDLDNSLTRTVVPIASFNGNAQMSVTRFLNATIPQGATVQSASYILTSHDTYNCGSCNMDVIVYGEDADTATALTLTNMNNLTQTTASATWSLQDMTTDVEYSKDVTSIIQEIVDRGGWSSGNNINIIVKDNGSDYAEWQQAYAYDGSPSKAPKLSITYAAGANPTLGSEEIAPGPAAYWRFDEGYGTSVNDTSGNSQMGTLGTGSSAPTWRSEEYCQNGSCLQFDGSDDYIQWADSSTLDIENELTISLWVKPISLQSSTYYTLVYKGNSTNDVNYYFQLYGDELNFGTYDSGWKGTSTTNADIQTNQWSHVVVTYSDASDDIDFYVNGILKTDDGFSHDLVLSADNQPFYLGSSAADLEFYDGFMDEVKIYPYVRSADEIKQDYLFSGAKGAAAVLGTRDQSFLSEGLVGYWDMDESSANTCTDGSNDSCDSSGNGNDGAWNGGATTGAGKYGNSIALDGSGDYIGVPDNDSLDITSAITLSAWIKTSGGDGTNAYIMTKNDDSFYFALGPTGTTANKLSFYLNGVTTAWVQGATSLNDNAWHHVVATYDGNVITLYVDGNVDATTNQTGTISSGSTTLRLGCRGCSSGDFFTGNMDEARIYKRALSLSEVKSLYEWAPGPVIYYDFDQGTGTTAVNDRSGNGRSGTMQNFSNSAWQDGKYGKGLLFDGSSTYVGITSPSLPTADFTYSFWANFKDIAVGGNEAVLDTGGNEFTVIITDGSFDIHTNGSWRTYTPTNVTTNTWNYVTVSRGGSTISVYLNGELENTATDGTAFDFSTCELLIGVDANSGCNASLADYSNLIMDELKIYNYARSREQILQDMNAGHPLIGTPVGSSSLHLKFDEGYGTTANDSSTQGNDGSISSATWTNDGKYGKALSFSGTSGYVNAGSDSSLDDLTTMSVSAWIYPTGYGEGSYGRIVNKSDTSGTNWGLTLVNNTSQQSIRFFKERNSGASATQVTASDGSIQLNQWYHVVGTYDENATPRMRIFINGKEASYSEQIEGTGSPDSDSTYNLTIGNRLNEDRTFQGTIDEVLLYPFALTDEQVKVVNNGGKTLVLGAKSTGVGGTTPSFSAGREYCVPGDAASCNPPIVEWKMDEGTGSALNDTSGNGYTSTFGSGSSAPSWVPGRVGKALSFNGAQYTSATVSAPSSPITIEFWAKPSTSSPVGMFDSAPAVGNVLRNYPAGYIEWWNAQPSVALNLTANRWSHLVFIYRYAGSTRYIDYYLNGQLQSTSSSVASNSFGWTTFVLGNINGGGAGWYSGLLDDFKIYNYARTPAQIAWEYNRGAPVAWYKMDECQGTTIYNAALNGDGKAAGNNGTITIGGSGTSSVGNCSTSSTAWGNGASGKINSSISLDGTDDYIDIGSTAMAYGTEGTITAWIKTADTLTSGYTILSSADEASTTRYLQFRVSGTSLEIAQSNNDTQDQMNANYSLSASTWYHVAVVSNGTSYSMYINGNQVSLTTATGSNTGDWFGDTDNRDNMHIGIMERTSQQYPFKGELDDVRVYNYPLTSNQVKQVYTNGAVSFK